MEEFSLIKEFAVIMAVAGIALLLFRRMGQPAILGYLLAGLLIGHFTLSDVSATRETTTIRQWADLGLVILLFALGLEFGWERIRQIGLSVVFIGLIEITFMIALGYEIGLLFGWTSTEAIFLGSALSISSSGILVKVLRDEGKLHTPYGRLIVGILVVEDFVAVILLSFLSAMVSSGTANLGDIGLLVGKLGLFSICALVFGTIFLPRLIKYVAAFHSREILLVVGLAMCFGLALVAHALGISPGAGAFLIGTVLGDSEESETILEIMTPVRDMFAGLFFVSIGMLVNVSDIVKFIGPALIVTTVFIFGKIIATAIGAFFSGHDGKSALTAAMGMPQIGEFSLAMIKVGADGGVIGSFLYPTISVVTAATSFLYPYIFRSADTFVHFLDARFSKLFKHYLATLELWLTALRESFAVKNEATKRLRHEVRKILINLGVMMVLIAAGTLALRFGEELSGVIGIQKDLVGFAMAGAVIALCAPPIIVMWKSLRSMTDILLESAFKKFGPLSSQREKKYLRIVLIESTHIAIVALLGVWALPFISQLLFFGERSVPVSLLLLTGLVAMMARTALKIHAVLEETFHKTFLGTANVRPKKGENAKLPKNH